MGLFDKNPSDFLKVNNAERTRQEQAKAIIEEQSDLGGRANPLGNTADTLFYQGAKNAAGKGKYGKFLFYGIGQGSALGNELHESYYLSENRAHNKNITPTASKNPSASQLVKLSQSSSDGEGNGGVGRNDVILGGSSAPYNWSDFLFCKYYGRIPNNYMVTLRRYPTPMLDNLSLPTAVKESDLHRLDGAGKPVAQAITWFGGNTGNTLNDIISFTTGINWDLKDQPEILRQRGFDTGLMNSLLGRLAGELEEAVTGSNAFLDAIRSVVEVSSGATEEGARNITNAKIQYHLRERAFDEQDGPLSDYIFVNVDTISQGYIRGRGLKFENSDITLNFHYELTSVGQVNSKATFLDVLANLLSLGTNYGSFLTPDYRYDNEFPGVGFPGGDDGLKAFYSAPVTFITKYLEGLSADKKQEIEAAGREQNENINAGDSTQTSDRKTQYSTSITDDIKNAARNFDPSDPNSVATLDRALRVLMTNDFIENLQFNLSFFTGAPIGEWHLVVGNPMNPIAMIGNLICDNVQLQFGDKLGPDDFPTELIATYTLKHARDRERGEIESMFNRGRGRLYQTQIRTSSNSQSEVSKSTNVGGRSPNEVDQITTSG